MRQLLYVMGVVLLAQIITLTVHSKEPKFLKLKNETVELSSSDPSKINILDPSIRYFVVQFANEIESQDQLLLKKMGLQIVSYVPDDAYIVRGSSQKIKQLKDSNSRVYAVAHYESNWKLSAEFQGLSVFDTNNSILMSVRFLPKANSKKIIRQFQDMKFQLLTKEERHVILRAPKVSALQVAEVEGVEWVQELPQFETFDFKISEDPSVLEDDLGHPETGFESGTKVMNFEQAWARGYTGSSQMVAMADTGLDQGSLANLHPDLKTVIGGEPVGIYGKDWGDPQGHGTHVTGSVVGQGTLSKGLIRGGAYNAAFYAQGMWSPMFNNISVPTDLKKMFGSSYAKGARVHTNSWGTVQNLGSYDNFSASVDEFMFNNQDFLIVFAAGNSGVDMDANGVVDPGSVSSPGTAKNTLTVGASENHMPQFGRQRACGEMNGGDKKWGTEPLKSDKLSNNINGIACFSSRGPTNDQRVKPDVVAPGTNIVSLRSFNPKATRLWGIYNENYSWAGGTSMATPLTAGAAAVTREYLVQKGFANPSSALIKAMLMHTARDLFPGQFGEGSGQEIPTARPNNVEGYGRVDMQAVTSLGLNKTMDVKDGVVTGEVKSASFAISGEKVRLGGTLRATLVYTDAPAVASASTTLVNNLNLEVVSPTGKIYALSDSVNNSEMIEITDVSEGTYGVNVIGKNVPMGLNGKQPYALIVSFVKN